MKPDDFFDKLNEKLDTLISVLTPMAPTEENRDIREQLEQERLMVEREELDVRLERARLERARVQVDTEEFNRRLAEFRKSNK